MKQTENTSVNVTDLTGVLRNSHTCHKQSENDQIYPKND